MHSDLPPIWLGVGLPAIVGLGFASFAWKTVREIARSRRVSSRATGRIVGWEKGYRESTSEDYNNGRPCHRARVRFRTTDGREVTFVSSRVSFRDKPSKGGELGVWYPRDEPEKAVVGGFFHRWGEPILPLIAATLGLAIAAAIARATFFPGSLAGR